MLLLSVYQLAKSFAGKNLFHDVSFGIEEGDRVGLLGPNGAGKSTLMKILASRMTADEGKVTNKRNLKVGYLEQDPQFGIDETILSSLVKDHEDTEALVRAYELLARWNLSSFGDDFKVSELSGGWKKRLALVRELMLEPDLLLLDEPTNHLDIESILELEKFLQDASFAFLMITHDRVFLQRVVNRVLDLDPRNPNYLLSVSGDYLQYLESKEQLLDAQNRREQVLKNTLRRETEWLRRGAKARQTKQKARIESAYQLADDVQDLKTKNRARRVGIDFGENERNPKKLIDAQNISKSFGGQTLFHDLNLLISPKTRLALLGANGSGKSTLIKVLLKQLSPDSGRVSQADGLQITYFEQNRETLNPQLSVLKNICPDGDYVSYRGQHIYARSYLERFLFFSQTADLPVDRLSGGEQARLRLAQMMLQESQVLVLDEPTNDLDVETLTVLEDALEEFNGAVILVTHDRYFMDQVCDDILACCRTSQGEILWQRFTGYEQYENWLKKPGLGPSADGQKKDKTDGGSRAEGGGKVKLSFKEQFEFDRIEAQILEKENELGALHIEIEKPETVSNSKELLRISALISTLQGDIEQLYHRWGELEKKSKGLF